MSLPFQSLSQGREWIAFFVSAAIATGLACWVDRLGACLKTTAAPQGIVSLELAWSTSNANTIVNSWNAQKRAAAIAQTWWDFLFLIAYPISFSFACALLSRYTRAPLSDFAVAFAWTVLFSGLLDFVENLCLLRMLYAGAQGWISQTATVCAAFKFALLSSVVGLLALAGLQWSYDRITG